MPLVRHQEGREAERRKRGEATQQADDQTEAQFFTHGPGTVEEAVKYTGQQAPDDVDGNGSQWKAEARGALDESCLLYTSDAADD